MARANPSGAPKDVPHSVGKAPGLVRKYWTRPDSLVLALDKRYNLVCQKKKVL
jgi:hypothetical protein